MPPLAPAWAEERRRAYAAKALRLRLTGLFCGLFSLATSVLVLSLRFGTPLYREMVWVRAVSLTLFCIGVLVFPLRDFRRYRRAADILKGALVRFEVNPDQAPGYWEDVEHRVDHTLHPPKVRPSRGPLLPQL